VNTAALRDKPKRTVGSLPASRSLLALVAVCACAISLAIVLVAGIADRQNGRLTVGDAIPAVVFRDERNQAFSLAALTGHRYALTFINTRCDDAVLCPATSAMFARAQGRIGNARLVEATIDPEYDTPAALTAYGRRFALDATHVRLVTGPDTVAFAQRFGVEIRRTPQGLAHTERLVIVDGDGHIERIVDDGAWIPDDLIAMLRSRDAVLSRFGSAAHHALVWCGAHLGHDMPENVGIVLGLLPIATIAGIIVFTRLRAWHERHRSAS